MRRARAYRAKGDLKSAGADENAALRLAVGESRFPDLANDRSSVLRVTERGTRADLAYRDAIATDDKLGTPRRDDADAAYGRCLSYLRLTGAWQAALRQCELAISLKPDFAEPYLVSCRFAATDPSASAAALRAAVRACDAARRLDPGLILARYFRGRAYARLGEDDAAIADFSAAISAAPRTIEFVIARAQAYHRKHDEGAVVADCTAVIEINATDAEAYALRAEAYRAMGKADKAADDERRIARLRNGTP